MPVLYVLRHAKSDQHLGLPDHERPHNDRGRRQAPDVGRHLAGQGVTLDMAVVSTATRTRETWDLVSAGLAERPHVHFDAKVYNASLDDLLEVVRELPDDAATVLLVGHNPGVSQLVAALTSEPVDMPTSALAVVELSSAWSEVSAGSGRLVTAGRPEGTT
jgi:phosphohistidine phosphatase